MPLRRITSPQRPGEVGAISVESIRTLPMPRTLRASSPTHPTPRPVPAPVHVCYWPGQVWVSFVRKVLRQIIRVRSNQCTQYSLQGCRRRSSLRHAGWKPLKWAARVPGRQPVWGTASHSLIPGQGTDHSTKFPSSSESRTISPSASPASLSCPPPSHDTSLLLPPPRAPAALANAVRRQSSPTQPPIMSEEKPLPFQYQFAAGACPMASCLPLSMSRSPCANPVQAQLPVSRRYDPALSRASVCPALLTTLFVLDLGHVSRPGTALPCEPPTDCPSAQVPVGRCQDPSVRFPSRPHHDMRR